METLIELLRGKEAGTVLIALLTTLVTGLVKPPLKRLAATNRRAQKYAKLITFSPLIVACLFTVVYRAALGYALSLGEIVPTWLSSAGLSLAVYAVYEQIFPGKTVMTEDELVKNREILEKVAIALENQSSKSAINESSDCESKTEVNGEKANQPSVSVDAKSAQDIKQAQ